MHEQMELGLKEEGQEIIIKAHDRDPYAERFYPGDKRPRWNKRQAEGYGLGDGMRGCSYCGSMHPQDLYDLKDLSTLSLSWADFKYGYPHKLYVNGIPNPMAGQEVASGSRSWTDPITREHKSEPIVSPASEFLTHKFYTLHFFDIEEEVELFAYLAGMIQMRTGILVFKGDKGLMFKRSAIEPPPGHEDCLNNVTEAMRHVRKDLN